MTKHLPPEKWLIYPDMLEISEFKHQKLVEATKKYFLQLPVNKKKQLEYVYGHTLFYGLHKLVDPHKEPFYFTFIREPIKRLTSLYNYYSQWYWLDPVEVRDKKDLYQKIILHQGQWPDFMTWYEKVFKLTEHKLNMCTSIDYFQRLGYLKKGKVSRENIQGCLDKFAFIGLVDSFTEDSLYLYHLWGINKFFIRQNISRKFFSLNDQPEIEAQLKAEFKDEYLFYELAKEKRQEFIRQHPDYYPAIEKMRQKRKLLLPLTQVVFDWPDNIHLNSSWLRKVVPGYGTVLNTVKSKLNI